MLYGKRGNTARRISFRTVGKRSGFSAIAFTIFWSASRNSDPKPSRSLSYHRYAVSISAAAAGRVTTGRLTYVHEFAREPFPRGCRESRPGPFRPPGDRVPLPGRLSAVFSLDLWKGCPTVPRSDRAALRDLVC